jgi:hypothetical protein
LGLSVSLRVKRRAVRWPMMRPEAFDRRFGHGKHVCAA